MVNGQTKKISSGPMSARSVNQAAAAPAQKKMTARWYRPR